MHIRPVTDHIVVKRDEIRANASEITAGTANEKTPSTGVVVAVGPGKNGENAYSRLVSAFYKAAAGQEEAEKEAERVRIVSTTTQPCEVGDRIVFATYAGSPMEIDGKDVWIMQVDDVMAVLESSVDIEA